MFIILEGLRNLGRAKLASFMVTVVIGIALMTSGWFFIITIKLHNLSGLFERAIEIEAFLDDTLPVERIEHLRIELAHNPAVAAVGFISKDSAAVIFSEEIGEDIQTVLGENPLPPSFRIRLKPDMVNPDMLDSLFAVFSSYTGVDDIAARREFILTLLRYRKILWITHIITGVVIFGLAIMLISNATRLSILSRKKSIEVMKLVGAADSFIKGPFIIEGLIGGLIGGIFSSMVILGVVALFDNAAGISIPVPHNLAYYLTGAGCFLGVTGSNVAVRRHLGAR